MFPLMCDTDSQCTHVLEPERKRERTCSQEKSEDVKIRGGVRQMCFKENYNHVEEFKRKIKFSSVLNTNEHFSHSFNFGVK